MTEPEQIEFNERVDRPIMTRGLARGGIVLGSALLFVVGVMSAMGASPSPRRPVRRPAPGTTPPAAPPRTATRSADGLRLRLRTARRRWASAAASASGSGGVTITAINGSSLSLKTDDGWTRTIAVTSDTTITRAGTTIAVGDLKVGDEIAFRQDRQDDGTYTITEIHVVLPTVAGQVTKIDGSTITVQRMDGTTQVIHVDGSNDLSGGRRHRPDACRTSRSTRSSSPRAPSGPTARSMPTRWPAASAAAGDHDGARPRACPGGKTPDGTSPSASPAPSTTPG